MQALEEYHFDVQKVACRQTLAGSSDGLLLGLARDWGART
jgi:hypothetical protein